MPKSGAPSGHRGTRAIQRMVEYAPATGGLALWVRHDDVAASDVPPGAPLATDGRTIRYAPAFAQLPVAEQAGLVAHAVLHVALRHVQRCRDLEQRIGDVDHRLFNLCADAIVNSTLAHLGWLRLPASSVHLDRLLKGALGQDEDVGKSLLEWDVERLYRAIDDRQLPAAGGTRGEGRARGEGGTDANPAGARTPSPDGRDVTAAACGRRGDGPRAARVRALGAASPPDLLPGTATAGAPEDEAEATREWRERLLRGHAGDGAHSLLRTLIADLPHSRTPWEQVLRTQLARGLAPTRGVSWSRPARSYIANRGRAGPHRRMPWEPGFSATKAVPRLAVIVDVSGSIADDLMARFAREIAAITRRVEADVVLVVGDARVRRVEHFAPGRADLSGIAFDGGGGTDFTPLLEEADRHRPDIAVVLTDLDGPANFRPRWPVIWAVPEAYAHAVAPFGRKLTLGLA